MKKTLLYLRIFFAAIAFVLFSLPIQINAQEIKPEFSNWSIGIEGGWMYNSQSGIFKSSDCGCTTLPDGVSGHMGVGDIFGEYELNPYWNFGLRVGVDKKSFSGSKNVFDSGNIIMNRDSLAFYRGNLIYSTQLSATYLSFAPYIRITPFGSGSFIEIDMGIASLSNSSVIGTRNLNFPNARFENGQNTETLVDGSIPNVKSIRATVITAVGYEFYIGERFSLLPKARMDIPLTKVADDPSDSNWEISSYSLNLGLKYKL